MELDQTLILIGTNVALIAASMGMTITLFLWARSEAGQDRRAWQEECMSDRRDMLTLLRGIQDEIKDFHYRLCKIEEIKK